MLSAIPAVLQEARGVGGRCGLSRAAPGFGQIMAAQKLLGRTCGVFGEPITIPSDLERLLAAFEENGIVVE